MKTKKIKKILATAMAISTSATILPTTQIAMATTESELNNNSFYYSEQLPVLNSVTTSAAVYYNDFESKQFPDQVSGVITTTSAVSIDTIGDGNSAMKFTSNFDGTSDWDSNKYEFDFNADDSSKIASGSTIQFDILIPTDKKAYDGTIKCTGAVKDSAWNWKSASIIDVNSSDFVDLGNGFSSKTVSISLASDIDGLKQVIAQISAYNCNYKDDIYIDNLQLIKKEANNSNLPSVSDLKWNFDTDNSGWSFGGSWDYKGLVDNAVSHDSTVGTGSMKLDVDYSNDASVSWSEFKINKTLDQATSFNGYNMLTYDFIYDPTKMTTGGFQTKLFITDSLNAYGSIDLANAVDVDNTGLKKAQVTLKFTSQDIEANSITIGIIGSSTDYKGNLYIDNIKLSQEQEQDVYVEKTATTADQVTVNVVDLPQIPTTVKLVDASATGETADLYAYLKGIGKTDKVLYGHQNDTHHKAVLKDTGTNSDTKDITGSISAICGIDALSLTGAELQLTDQDKANGIDLISKAAQLGIDASSEGGIVTLSAHMPNFELVKEKGTDANRNYDYSGYTPGVTTGNIASRIMPGGDLNTVYTGYLKMIATYAHKLEAAGVPVIFRPFHENNGSWFWWGKAFCDEEAYKNMYRYTVEYLRDTENVHNFLYVYSPNGPFEDKNDYLSRYPGDEFIDILAFDFYDDNPTADASTDPWIDSFKKTIDLVQGIAEDGRGKLSAVSEVGIRVNGSGLGVSGNVDKKWFSEVSNIISKSNMPYYMVWANFGESDGFFAPYMVSNTKGHEMINDFIDYYNEAESVFANGVGDYSLADAKEDSAYSYGFITGPTSRSRVLEPTKITASVKGYDGKIKFVLKNKAGESISTLDGTLTDNSYSADITQDILDKIGETIGSIELYSGDKLLDTISVLFNMKEAAVDPKVVDNFETYSGEDTLLQNTWTANQGSGCKVTANLFEDNYNSGKYGLAFNYKISSGGYAGITKSLTADWSDCDALQFWCKPDGKGQKLVIQVTSNGQDFEVFMPEFAATTEAKLITLKFSDFKPKTAGTTLDLANISKMGIWCNTIGTETVDSTMYFDDIKAINTSEVKNDDSDNNSGTSGGETGNVTTGGGTSSSSSHHHSSGSTTSNDTNTASNGNTSTTTSQEAIKNNWVQENGSWKYVDEQGAKISDAWKQVNGNWYYFNKDSTMKTGWLKDKENNWYYLQSDGAMKTDWIKDSDGRWYYLQSNGAMKVGWLLDKDNSWYYLQSNGVMKTGWIEDTDGKWYYLKINGTMAKNGIIDGYLLGENGAWIIQ